MQRKFLTNLALLLFLNFLVKPFWILGIDRTVQNMVGEEAYGFYFTILNFSFLFNILLDLGITQFNNRNIAQHKQLLNKHLSGILIIKILLAVVYTVFTFSVALIINYNGEQLYILAWVCFNQFILSFITYLRSNISGLLMFKTDSFLSVLDRILMILICSVLIWGHVFDAPFNIKWFVYAQTLAYVLTALFAFIVVAKKARFKKLNWNLAFFMMIIKRSFPFAILIFFMTIYYRSDSILIEGILKGDLGDQQVGVFAKAFRLLDAVNIIPLLFAVLLYPIFSRMIKNKESVVQMVKLSFSLLFTLAVIVAIGSAFYRYELMDLLYYDNINEAARIYGKIMFSFIAVSCVYVFGSLLTANGNLKQLAIISLAAVVVNYTLNILLIPKYMALGSAYANVATQFVAAIPQVWLACKVFKFKWDYKYLSSLVVFVILVVFINYISQQLNVEWILRFVIMIIASFITASLLKLMSVKALIRIIKE